MRMRLAGLSAAAMVVLAACSGNGSGGTPQAAPAGGGGSAQSYCALSRSYLQQYEKLDTPQGIRQVYEDAARDIHAALAVAPAEIRADVKVLSDGLDRLIAVLAKYDYDSGRLAEAPDD
ncbi:MAG: hypothetical protein ACRD12_21305, partial [Acidimicrobiales bacterium]